MSAIDEFLEYREQLEKTAAPGVKAVSGAASVVAPDLASTFLKDIAEKGIKGGLGNIGKLMLGTGLAVAPAIALGMGWEAGGDAFDAAAKAIKKHRGFRGMLRANPELKEQDKNKVHAAYSTLHKFNPEMASDPFVAGSWVKQVSEYDAIPTKTVGDLIAARARGDRKSALEAAAPFMGASLQAARAQEERAYRSPEYLSMAARAQGLGRAEAEAADFPKAKMRAADLEAARGIAKARVEEELAARPSYLEAQTAKATAQQVGKQLGTTPIDPMSMESQKRWAGAIADRQIEEATVSRRAMLGGGRLSSMELARRAKELGIPQPVVGKPVK